VGDLCCRVKLKVFGCGCKWGNREQVLKVTARLLCGVSPLCCEAGQSEAVIFASPNAWKPHKDKEKGKKWWGNVPCKTETPNAPAYKALRK